MILGVVLYTGYKHEHISINCRNIQCSRSTAQKLPNNTVAIKCTNIPKCQWARLSKKKKKKKKKIYTQNAKTYISNNKCEKKCMCRPRLYIKPNPKTEACIKASPTQIA